MSLSIIALRIPTYLDYNIGIINFNEDLTTHQMLIQIG